MSAWSIRGVAIVRMELAALLTIVLCITLCSGNAMAEIYRWTDADGKVHFGDKPADHGAADKAKAVTLKPGYEPVQRSAEEEAAFVEQQKVFRQANEARRSAEQKVRDEAAAKRREDKIAYCADLKRRLQELSEISYTDKGERYIYYTEKEDGSSVTVSEQKKIIAGLREQIERERC